MSKSERVRLLAVLIAIALFCILDAVFSCTRSERSAAAPAGSERTGPDSGATGNDGGDTSADAEDDETSEDDGDDDPGLPGDAPPSALGFPGHRDVAAPRKVARASLASSVAAAIGAKGLAKAKIGLIALSATTGEVICERSADDPLIVASNAKVMTVTSALAWLGKDFEFKTRWMSAAKPDAAGVLHGDLTLLGDGDPDCVPDGAADSELLLARLVAALRAAGVTRVEGDLVVDDRIFDRQYVPEGWTAAQLPHAYAAPVSGFSLMENCLRVQIAASSPVKVEVDPASSYFNPVAAVSLGAPKSKNTIHVAAPAPAGTLKVTGTTPAGGRPEPLWVPIADPLRAAGHAVFTALSRAGVAMGGTVRFADAQTPAATGLVELAAVGSPLARVLMKLDKESTNVLAEHLYKRAGAAREGAGSFASGGRAVLAAMERNGIATRGAATFDGSGLSRANRFTPRQLAETLRALWRSDARDTVLETLPIAGVDGTLRKRFREPAYRCRVRAKTGYIAGVSTLSGYAATDSGEVICFSILVNDGGSAAKGAIDAVARLLVDLEPGAK